MNKRALAATAGAAALALALGGCAVGTAPPGSKGVIPPKGGHTSLADADVRSAVDYMVAQAR